MANVTVELPPMSTVAIGFGPMVTGMMLQQLFLGVLSSQAAQYYSTYYAKDSVFTKTIVGSLVVLNIFLSCLDFHVLYRTAVLLYGQYDFFDLQEWTMWIEPGTTAIIGGVAQVFFLVRCWRFARNWFILIGLTLLCLFACGSGLSVTVAFFRVKRFSNLALIPTQITLWLVSTSVCDIAIAAILIFYFAKSKTPVKKTEAVISRLIRQSMETSFVTAVCATLNFIFYKALPTTAYHLLPQFSMARIYSMTVMYTLLSRHALRDVMSEGNGTFATGFFDNGVFDSSATRFGNSGIRVNVEATTRSDAEASATPPNRQHDIALTRIPSDEWKKARNTDL
ncbi:uncharacterized protein STEHIDRAFT_150638 [Stereum hirsutum FP-91666 SS1]|uniref:DUF6534 domain-containing protein n=1 Tax=Stereum hirsutum (strain FP-91666) TaxID=721885 RepID=R7RYI7_STEHR|nr:uncharacterized protein STEHIDRAFT_150638 [Stereum hirsutum FP-91666 SS1]EIM80471.1 hypothetical protein STEHIDRAFT_150638 [Stereum hirsutum FP-91666 SS1]